uniref:Uncharacterized protein n=1 Tax=Rhizophora mucronata TaxID=61149 RepID=A0A2P2L442_RHIMU
MMFRMITESCMQAWRNNGNLWWDVQETYNSVNVIIHF